MARKSDPAHRQRIVREAEHLIHLRGYQSTSLDEIAGSLGMTKANLLHHFHSKEDLGLAVLDYKIEAYHKERQDSAARCPDPVRRVAEIFSSAACFFRGNGCRAGCFVGNIALEMSDVSDRFREKVRLFFEEWAAQLARCLRRGREAGYFAATLDPRSAAEAILALYEGSIMLARSRRDPAVFARVGKQACRLLEAHRTIYKKRGETSSAKVAKSKGGCNGTQDALRLLNQ